MTTFNEENGGFAPLQTAAINQQAQNSSFGLGGSINSGGFTPVTAGSSMAGGNFGLNAGGSQPGFFEVGGTAQMGLGALQTLGSLWNSFNQNKLAKKSLKLQTKAFNTNLANETQSYNTALEDRIRARHAVEGRDSSATDDYIKKHSL